MTVTPATLRRLPMDAPYFATYAPSRFPMEQFDYIDEEWIATGVENGHAYETTVLVRRPRDTAKFSGTLLVEPLHYSGIVPMWLYMSTYIMREGHAWAMISSQRTTILDHVKNSNPERYDSLHIDGPEGLVVGSLDFTATESLADFWVTVKQANRASSTILAQVGAALRASDACGAPIQHMLLMGHSQTGSVVTYYIEEAHESERLADGRSIYDGYCPTGYPAGAFGPCDVPIVQVMSDGDVSHPLGTFVGTYPNRQYRRDDSDDASNRYRLYELAGVPHMGTRYPPFDDVNLWIVNQPGAQLGGEVRMNTLPHNELFNVCLDHLVRWVAEGVVPPRAPRIETKTDGWFAVDEHGHAKGGVRCVQVDVPRAHYYPNVPNPDGTLTIQTVGTEVAFTADEMRSLYGSIDAYRERFEARLAELVAEGWLLPADVDYMRDDLAKVSAL